MQKNWYIVYTKPRCEKKVVNSLAKREIESFCPFNRKQIQHLRKNKLVFEPLFNSYVFVSIEENNIPLLAQLENIVSLVHWKCKPAIIMDEEIALIKDFTANYCYIRLEKNNIDSSGYSKNVENDTNYKIDGNILRIINRSVKVNLPSLGFIMIADIDKEDIQDSKISVDVKKLLFQ